MTRRRSCTEYWLDTQTGTFRGDFETMYRDIDDPWGCESGRTSLNNQVFMQVIFDGDRRFARMLDIGSGLGGLLDEISRRNGRGFVLGVDVSQTAVDKARLRYPNLAFECRDVAKADLGQGDFDLITMSEVLWYILADVDVFFGRVAGMMASGGTLAVHQYFPAAQRYGRDTIDGVQGFMEFMHRQQHLKLEHMYTNHRQDGVVLLATFKREH